MLYTIKFAEISDYQLIKSFIDNHWKKNHALVKSKDLFDFQHLNPIMSNYNFIIAINNETNEIDALLGFIPTYQYDKSLFDNGDYWGAIWKVRSDVKNSEIKTIGGCIWEKLFEFENFHSWGAIGISAIAKKLYEISGMKIGALNHYYMVNDTKNEFKIAKNIPIRTQNHESDCCNNSAFSICTIDIDKIKNNIDCSYKPQKTITYLVNRYQNHPIYKYEFWGIMKENTLLSIWVIRVVNANNSKVIRVVDILGDVREDFDIRKQLQNKLYENDAEYIDILNYGISENIFFNLGFSMLDFNGDIIIPNYFEPFEQQNVKIELAYRANYNYVVFRGDSDQDRPNVIN